MSDVMQNLRKLIGGANTSQVQDALKQAQAQLDQVGIERKADEGGEKPDDAILSALESAGAEGPAKLVKGILDALAGDALTALEKALGSHDEVVKVLLKAVTGEPEKADPAPAGATESPYVEEMKSVKDYIASTTKDMGEMARSFVDIAKAVKTTGDDNAKLVERIAALEKQLGDRPRQASTAVETIVKSTDGKAEEAIHKSLDETASVAGIRVKKQQYEEIKKSRK